MTRRLTISAIAAVLGLAPFAVCVSFLAYGQTAPPPPVPPYSTHATLTVAKCYVNVRAYRAADGTYMAHPTFVTGVKCLRVCRNGLRQAPGVDYSFSAATGVITPLPAAGAWAADDIVLLDFDR